MTRALMFVSGAEDYLPHLIGLIKESKGKLCYVSFNKTAGGLVEIVKKNKIDSKRLYVVDCITKILKEPQRTERTKFISDPQDLDAISNAILSYIAEGSKTLIFDKLSNVLIYGEYRADDLRRFIKTILTAIDQSSGNSIFICNEKDKEHSLMLKFLDLFNKFNASTRPLLLNKEDI